MNFSLPITPGRICAVCRASDPECAVCGGSGMLWGLPTELEASAVVCEPAPERLVGRRFTVRIHSGN